MYNDTCVSLGIPLKEVVEHIYKVIITRMELNIPILHLCALLAIVKKHFLQGMVQH